MLSGGRSKTITHTGRKGKPTVVGLTRDWAGGSAKPVGGQLISKLHQLSATNSKQIKMSLQLTSSTKKSTSSRLVVSTKTTVAPSDLRGLNKTSSRSPQDIIEEYQDEW